MPRPPQPGGRGIRAPAPSHPPRAFASALGPAAEPLPRVIRLGSRSWELPLFLVLMRSVVPERPRWSFRPNSRSSHWRAHSVTGGTEVAAGRSYRRHRIGQERGSPAAGGARCGAHRRGRGRQGGGRARFAGSGAGGRGIRAPALVVHPEPAPSPHPSAPPEAPPEPSAPRAQPRNPAPSRPPGHLALPSTDAPRDTGASYGGHSVRIAWLIRAMWLIRCTIDPQINHEARINHDKISQILALASEKRDRRY